MSRLRLRFLVDAKPAPKKRGRKPKSASVQPQAGQPFDIDKKPESVTEKSVTVEETAQMIRRYCAVPV